MSTRTVTASEAYAMGIKCELLPSEAARSTYLVTHWNLGSYWRRKVGPWAAFHARDKPSKHGY